MSNLDNSNLVERLNQIRKQQESINAQIESIKETADAQILPHLEEIENNGFDSIMELDELVKKDQGKVAAADLEPVKWFTGFKSKTPWIVGDIRVD